jgi:small nuclear ribonucleoprotein (snRNP)-like protein
MIDMNDKGGFYVSNYYELAKEHQGQRVTITDRSGAVYTGRLMNVDTEHVYLEVEQDAKEMYEQDSYDRSGGYGYYQPLYPAPYPPPCPKNDVIPIALAAIGGFALASAFFWW